MTTKIIKVYLHRSKEDNRDLGHMFCFPEDSPQENKLAYMGYQVEAYFQINLLTGESKLIGADGFFLSEEAVTSHDIDEAE